MPHDRSLPAARATAAAGSAARLPAGRVIGATPAWGAAAAEQLLETLLGADQPFPCTFAVAAVKKQSLCFGFVDSAHDETTWAPLAGILREYLGLYQQLGKDTSLVVLFRPEEQPSTLDDYFDRFWAVLQYLHDGDTEPWPASTPLDPGEVWWEFSFGGTEIFVVCNTPAHVNRRSRHNRSFMITFQPRWVFEGLEAHTPRGAKARQVIRNRIRRFDGMEPAGELGNHGEEGNREWRQYFLADTADGTVAACPFTARAGARGQQQVPVAPLAADADQSADYSVLVNSEGQFSLWPAAVPAPGRWRTTGFSGGREECLRYVSQVWTDMRPARSRQRAAA
ncbi:YqcI/YcgG family protein [Streptomyces sp. IBSBF 2435]|uniref:YqcI/YcgG family protein n=1 Tax=Streptomyces sp. IBSBF 2435 TaxID=2903531 RepID=UPI002FDC454C